MANNSFKTPNGLEIGNSSVNNTIVLTTTNQVATVSEGAGGNRLSISTNSPTLNLSTTNTIRLSINDSIINCNIPLGLNGGGHDFGKDDTGTDYRFRDGFLSRNLYLGGTSTLLPNQNPGSIFFGFDNTATAKISMVGSSDMRFYADAVERFYINGSLVSEFTTNAGQPEQYNQCHVVFQDNTYDIGTDDAGVTNYRPRNVLVGTSLQTPLLQGNSASGANLSLNSTSHATKGIIKTDGSMLLTGLDVTAAQTTPGYSATGLANLWLADDSSPLAAMVISRVNAGNHNSPFILNMSSRGTYAVPALPQQNDVVGYEAYYTTKGASLIDQRVGYHKVSITEPTPSSTKLGSQHEFQFTQLGSLVDMTVNFRSDGAVQLGVGTIQSGISTDLVLGTDGGGDLGLYANGGPAFKRFNNAYIKSNLGVGTSAVNDASAIIQADSTTQGILMPRMSTAQKIAISSPAAGLMVYDTTLNKLCVFTTTWETITSI